MCFTAAAHRQTRSAEVQARNKQTLSMDTMSLHRLASVVANLAVT